LSSSAIRDKTPLEVCSRKVAQDCNWLQIFACLTYYYVKEDKMSPRPMKGVLMDFKKGVKGYKFGIQRIRKST